MRNVTTATSTQLNTATGTESVLIVGIDWESSSTTEWFATKDITVGSKVCKGVILSVGTFTSEKKSENSGTVNSINLMLSDADGTFKDAIDNYAIERSTIIVYQHFVGNAETDLMLLMIGTVEGRPAWDEGQRAFNLTAVSKLKSSQMGYAPTTTDYPDLMPEASGVAWPMIFGSCAHVPALQVYRHSAGMLMAPISLFKSPAYATNSRTSGGKTYFNLKITDSPDVYNYASDVPELNKIYVEGGNTFPSGTIKIEIAGVIFEGSFTGNTFNVTESNLPLYTDLEIGPRLEPASGDADDPDSDYSILWLADPTISLVGKHVYFQTAAAYEWYNFCVYQEGTKCYFEKPFRHPITKKLTRLTPTFSITKVYNVLPPGLLDSEIEHYIFFENMLWGFGRVGTPTNNFGVIQKKLATMTDGGENWWFCPADVEVHLFDQANPDVYVASAIELDEVKVVYGQRRVTLPDGREKTIFAPIPESYYTVQLASAYPVNSAYASAIIIDPPLSTYTQANWDNNIFVSAKSTVGPNVIDVVEYILDNYTDLSIDSTSFSHARSVLADVPVNFAVFDTRDALSFVEEILYQARCALIIEVGYAIIKVLAENPTSVMTFNETNVGLKSITITSSDTSDISTKLIAKWNDTYRHIPPLALVNTTATLSQILKAITPGSAIPIKQRYYTSNSEYYGHLEKDVDVYIYNTELGVNKFLDFYGIRYANVWRKISFETFLPAIRLQPFDAVTLNFTTFTNLNTKCLVESMAYDFQSKVVTLDLWIPIRTGGNTVLGVWPGA